MTGAGRRLRGWWTDDPQDPDRRPADHPDVVRLVDQIAPGGTSTDLGGHYSLNLRLIEAGVVLRVHQPFVSRRRLLDLQRLRVFLARTGVAVAEPLAWQGRTVVDCGGRWAEVEPYVPHDRRSADRSTSAELLDDLGGLHRSMAAYDAPIVAPVISTWSTPRSLLRWLHVGAERVGTDGGALDALHRLRVAARAIGRRWIPASRLPAQVVHGDATLNNLPRTAGGSMLALDFGFSGRRPRTHDLAHTLHWTVAVLGRSAADHFAEWTAIFEQQAGARLSDDERAAVPALAASVSMHRAAVAGLGADPVTDLRGRGSVAEDVAWWLSLSEEFGPSRL